MEYRSFALHYYYKIPSELFFTETILDCSASLNFTCWAIESLGRQTTVDS